jgi:predicted dienelactone hydrolase
VPPTSGREVLDACPKFFVAIAFCLSATLAQAAGFRFIDVPAGADGPALKGAKWYPCSEPSGEIELGGVVLPSVKECPIAGNKRPLVAISHGDDGNFWSSHDTAERLADGRFIVAAIDHPGDNHSDMSRFADLSMIVGRPTDINRLIDFMLGASPAASQIEPDRIGFFGVSAGGYTALVLIGANPDWASASEFCQNSSFKRCGQIRRQEFPVKLVVHDPRIKAAVLADRAPFSFPPAASRA